MYLRNGEKFSVHAVIVKYMNELTWGRNPTHINIVEKLLAYTVIFKNMKGITFGKTFFMYAL